MGYPERVIRRNILTVIPGPDVAASIDTVIGARRTQPVEVPIPDLSRLRGYPVAMSMRSRRAQGGLDGADKNARDIARAFRRGLKTTTVPITNHADRSHFVPGGKGLFAMYGYTGREFLNGDVLTHLIDSGTIGIEGQYGVDWRYWSPNGAEPNGVEFRIDPDSRTTIPPHPRGEPITMVSYGHSNDFRPQLVNGGILVPLKDAPSAEEITLFCVAETTAKLGIPEDKIGFIDRNLEHPGNSIQTNAPLLYGGNTQDWPVRIETVGPPPETIVVHFANSEK